jgi:DNA sulfur modification protein DndE
MIDRLRLTAGAKQQLTTLKRRTGIEHYNVICRHALCASLANPAPAPDEHLQFANGLEIEWRTFAGDADTTYLNLLIVRSLADEGDASPATLRRTLSQHVHRGLSYLVSRQDSLLTPSPTTKPSNGEVK